jgi:hypothetical protein
MQVPIAVALDAAFGSPRWVHAAGRAALTLAGGGVVLAGFFGITVETRTEEAGARPAGERWQRQAAALRAALEGGEEEERGGPGARPHLPPLPRELSP